MPALHSAAELLAAARSLLPRAMAPYSGYRVGAALEDAAGEIHPGINVESVSYGLTLCAERNALFGAMARGAREFRRLAVVAGGDKPVRLCGACRQVLLEYAPELLVILDRPGEAPEEIPIRDLLPSPFTRFESAP